MFGILNINKPAGWTSRDVVNRVQRLVRPAKAGHAGTLDPLATGVLVVCVGPATRLISYVQQMPKTYQATFLLGRTSRSDDTESDVSPLVDPPQPTRQQIQAQLSQFNGSIQQRPPAFSAIKVNGQRAYHLARQGQAVELKPRTVQIDDLAIEHYQYPELQLSLRCGSGTYVRSVGRDLAASLGTGAVMSALERTAIGEFNVSKALDVENLCLETIREGLTPARAAVAQLPQLELSDSQVAELSFGRLVSTQETSAAPSSPDEVLAASNSEGELVALVRERRPGQLGAMCNFC